MLTIKPHHFMDIIKLYGKGITEFIPDEQYHHAFYRVANEILGNGQTLIQLTLGRDDICSPCNRLTKEGTCGDPVNHIPGVDSKHEWNRMLDRRIMEYTDTTEGSIFSARDYCTKLYCMKKRIFDIWKEEDDPVKNDRYQNFCNGAVQYLNL